MFQTDWRQVILDPVEKKIFEALEDPRWEWRTISTLSRVSGLVTERTRRILQTYPVLVRQLTVPGPGGEELYTLQRRHYERQTVLEKFWTSVSSSTSSST